MAVIHENRIKFLGNFYHYIIPQVCTAQSGVEGVPFSHSPKLHRLAEPSFPYKVFWEFIEIMTMYLAQCLKRIMCLINVHSHCFVVDDDDVWSPIQKNFPFLSNQFAHCLLHMECAFALPRFSPRWSSALSDS